MTCRAITISSQAYLSIVAETYSHLHTETGGILLGVRRESMWHVVDAIDPGYRDVTRRPGYFEYDTEYVTHLANIRARLYANGIELLGLWHRHPGSLDRFSSTDDETHRLYVAQNAIGALSILVNLDPDLRMTAYYISPSLQHTRVLDITVGDSHVPSDLLTLRTPESYFGRSTQRVTAEPKHGMRESLKGAWSNLTGTFKPEPAPTATPPPADLVLDMLDSELAHSLENQLDYDYTIAMRDNSIDISLTYVGEMPYYPRHIGCRLFTRGAAKWCEIDDRVAARYEPGMIRRYVNQAVEQRAASSDQPTQSAAPASVRSEEIPSQDEARHTDVLSEHRPLVSEGNDPRWESVRRHAERFGLSYGFSGDELKSAYRKLMKDVHPDVWHSEGNRELADAAGRETQRVREAYEALMEYCNDRNAP